MVALLIVRARTSAGGESTAKPTCPQRMSRRRSHRRSQLVVVVVVVVVDVVVVLLLCFHVVG
jgi:hypothetical protein